MVFGLNNNQWQMTICVSLREISLIIGLQTINVVGIWSDEVVLAIVTHFHFSVFVSQMYGEKKFIRYYWIVS
jgi:hypothetical protein